VSALRFGLHLITVCTRIVARVLNGEESPAASHVWQSPGMGFDAETIVGHLESEGVRLDRGLTEADLRRIEKKFGFSFGLDHRALLRLAMPSGDAWLNWRHATAAKIRERLQAAADASGGADDVPLLVPLYGACYLPAAPAGAGSPVFEVTPGEVRVHSADLLQFVRSEFG
jgi:hypothetical protein